jgi:MFS family permease
MLPISNAEKKRRLPFALAGDSANSIFANLSVFGPVFVLFLDQLGLDEKQIGTLLSLFPFCGLIAPFVAGRISRFGFKRTFLLFFGIRKTVILFLLFAPAVASRFGREGAFGYVILVTMAFTLCRSISEIAYNPWYQEYIPESVRGRFQAMQNILTGLFGSIATLLAAQMLKGDPSINRFLILFVIAVVFGFLSVFAFSFVPGGRPIAYPAGPTGKPHSMFAALRDLRFMRFCAAMGLVLLGSTLGVSFVPLYLSNEIGLSDSDVLMVQMTAGLALLVSAFGWGWAADRYGSRPVLIVGLFLGLLYPLGLIFLPRHESTSFWWAVGLTALIGLITPGWSIGVNRLFFAGVVPVDRKTTYLAIYYAWVGLIGGIGPLAAGQLLDLGADYARDWRGITVDVYTILFALHIVLVASGGIIFYALRDDRALPVRQFIGMFLRGNPIAAVQSIIAFNFARDEIARIRTTEHLTLARSPLIVDELLEALSDPSFNVRFEAVVAIGRSDRNDRLTDALIDIVRGPESDLSVVAALALGRIGDQRAVPTLRESLLSEYPMLAARSARSIALLGDQEVVPLLLARFRDELNKGLRVSYASALGALKFTPATLELLVFLRELPGETQRWEIALAVAEIAGKEANFIHLWRKWRVEPDVAMCEAVLSLKQSTHWVDGASDLQTSADFLAAADFSRATRAIAELIDNLRPDTLPHPVGTILSECSRQLRAVPDRREYLLLAIHALGTI